MNETARASEYLVISRGQWDQDASPQNIQKAIDEFYIWLARLIDEGKMKTGQRLANTGRTVSRNSLVTDGPFGEAKEVIGGYWFIRAGSLEEAAGIAAENPCLPYGLFYEIRPIDPERASAFNVTTETPPERISHAAS
ncbi:MAG: YciI family protein [Chthoniobacteraceae bacterium]